MPSFSASYGQEWQEYVDCLSVVMRVCVLGALFTLKLSLRRDGYCIAGNFGEVFNLANWQTVA